MNKTRLFFVLTAFLASLLLISVGSAFGSCETPECFCEGADLIIPVDMMVVGDGCYKENLIQDSTQINMLESADYEIYGIVSRGNIDQSQANEAFYLEIDNNKGPTSVDDADPTAITKRREFLLYQYLTQGTHEVIMHTTAQCPPDMTANSVELTHICLYKDSPEPPTIDCTCDSDCNDNNELTSDSCINPNTPESYCQNTPITPPIINCYNNADCNDNNELTSDVCIFPATQESYCENTQIEISLLITSPESKTYKQKEITFSIESNSPKVKYSLDNAPEQDYFHVFNLLLNHGEHTIKAFAYDSQNNLLKQESLTFTIDLQKKKSSDDEHSYLNCEYLYSNYYYFNEPYNELFCPYYEDYFPAKETRSQTSTTFSYQSQESEDQKIVCNPDSNNSTTENSIIKQSINIKSLLLILSLFLLFVLLFLVLASLFLLR